MSYNFVAVKKADQENSKNNGKVRQHKRCLAKVEVNKKLSTLPDWLCNLWIEHMCSLRFELHDIYTKIDIDSLFYTQCKHIGEYH